MRMILRIILCATFAVCGGCIASARVAGTEVLVLVDSERCEEYMAVVTKRRTYNSIGVLQDCPPPPRRTVSALQDIVRDSCEALCKENWCREENVECAAEPITTRERITSHMRIRFPPTDDRFVDCILVSTGTCTCECENEDD